MAPVSKPILSAIGAYLANSVARAPGFDLLLPSKTDLPTSSTTQTAVSYCETSNPT